MKTFINLQLIIEQVIRSFAQVDQWFDKAEDSGDDNILEEICCLNQQLEYLFSLPLANTEHKTVGEVMLSEHQLHSLRERIPGCDATIRMTPYELREHLRDKLFQLLVTLEDQPQEGLTVPYVHLAPVTNLSVLQLHQLIDFRISNSLERLKPRRETAKQDEVINQE